VLYSQTSTPMWWFAAWTIGGGLAAAVALAAQAHGVVLAGQCLLVPMLAPPNSYPSYSLFARCVVLPAATMGWFWRCYAPRGLADFQDMFCCPIDAPANILKLVPPAFVWTASCDVLRDEGEAYVTRMRDLGVNVVHVRGKGSHIGCMLSKTFVGFVGDFCKHLITE